MKKKKREEGCALIEERHRWLSIGSGGSLEEDDEARDDGIKSAAGWSLEDHPERSATISHIRGGSHCRSGRPAKRNRW